MQYRTCCPYGWAMSPSTPYWEEIQVPKMQFESAELADEHARRVYGDTCFAFELDEEELMEFVALKEKFGKSFS